MRRTVLQRSLIFFVLVFFVACTNNRFKKTESGLQYKIYTDNKGRKARLGDFVTLYMIYKSPQDSILFDSRNDGAPWHFELKKPPFRGSYEEGLTMMAAGDSASFLVSADSMFTLVFKKPLPPDIASGSKLRFDIKLLNVETAQEAAMVKRKEMEERTKIEERDIQNYLREHNLALAPTPEGLYFLKLLQSTGVAPDGGSTCRIEYTGKLLDGKVFDSTTDEGHPKLVTLGQNSMLKGWEQALLLMRTGEKAIIILPSRLAFGAEGKRNPNTGAYDVYPYTPVVYELTLRAVK